LAEHASYLRMILGALIQGVPISDVRATLTDVARQACDEELKLYLAPVRRLLAAQMQNVDDSEMPLPLDRPPFSALIAYCHRRMRT
jgi:hypothetical protein